MSYVLGIDIGGTKIHLRARPQKGREVNLIVPSIGHLHEVGSAKLVRELTVHVKSVCGKIGKKQSIDSVCIGMSGLDTPKNHRDILRELNKQGWWKQVDSNSRILVNDIIIGMRAGTIATDAMAIVSGTGSNACVFEGDSRYCVSGKGALLSDEGSGYAIGLSALKAATKAEDGRGPKTKILDGVLKHFKVSNMGDVADKLKSDNAKQNVAMLNKVVETIAENGDRVARQIIKEASEELILMLSTLRRHALKRNTSVDVVLIGGTINKNKPLLREFLRKSRKYKWANIIPLSEDPVQGAVMMAQEARN